MEEISMINQLMIKQYDAVRKASTGQDDNYATGDADPRAIQQILFQGKAGRLYTILEKPKETVLAFYKGTAKVL